MRVTWTAGSVAVLFGLVLLSILGIVIYVKREAIGAWLRSLLSTSFNPASSDNVVNKGVETLVTRATGRDETLGGLLAEWFDPSTRAVAESLKRKDVVAPSYETGSFDMYGTGSPLDGFEGEGGAIFGRLPRP